LFLLVVVIVVVIVVVVVVVIVVVGSEEAASESLVDGVPDRGAAVVPVHIGKVHPGLGLNTTHVGTSGATGPSSIRGWSTRGTPHLS